MVRLATTSVRMKDYLGMLHSYSENIDFDNVMKISRERVNILADYFAEAMTEGADLVPGYESITGAANYEINPDTFELFRKLSETVPGPTTEIFSKIASKHEAYCAICLEEQENDLFYNTAVLIDRKGEIAGKYRKVHLPPQEREHITPGNGFPTFETDFGKVAFSICYDMMFPETARCAAMNDADLLVHMGNTSYTLKEETVRVRASDNKFWVLTCDHEQGHSMLVAPSGDTVLRANRHTHGVLWADVDLNLEHMLWPDNIYSGVKSLRGRMCQERVPEAYQVICNPEPPLLSKYDNDQIPRTTEEFAKVRQSIIPELKTHAQNRDRKISHEK